MRGHYQALLPTITGPIQAARQPFLVRDWQIAQSATKKPVKITVPGPLTIGDSVADDFYRDPRTRGAALADALNVEIRRLAEAGCPVIQIDEPVFARRVEDAVAFGLEHLERCFHKVPPSTERVVHVCCGYPDRLDAEDYPKAPKEAYFELAGGLDEVALDAVAIEDAHRPNDLSLLERFSRTKVILGVIAIARSRVEEVEEVRDRLRAAQGHIDSRPPARRARLRPRPARPRPRAAEAQGADRGGAQPLIERQGNIFSTLARKRGRIAPPSIAAAATEGAAMAPRTERKLAAILAADVVGYSRLVGDDEAGTIARLKALRKEFIEPLIAEYRGRVVKLMGDGALLEFASAVDAVECAVAIQNGVAEREAAVPEDRRLAFRIGINVGDIIVEDGDILGDGVNVAARLEGLAEPGGICIARNVYNQVKAKLDLAFEPMGEHRVKNIAEPLTVYRLNLDAPGRASHRRSLWTQSRWQAAAAAVVLLLAAAATGAWYTLWPPVPESITAESAAVTPAAAKKPALPLPDKPSIAVLPFDNLSGDPKQERLAGGLTEDVITDLSRFRELFVIARNSTEVYKGKAVDIRQVGRELGVRYVLEGSLQID